jgi:hypothetical protein
MPPLKDDWVDLPQAACFLGLNVISLLKFGAGLAPAQSVVRPQNQNFEL